MSSQLVSTRGDHKFLLKMLMRNASVCEKLLNLLTSPLMRKTFLMTFL